jgi:predicted YcjX-like family ATPase
VLNPLDYVVARTVRVGVTGLARAGKTAFLTSLAANLLAHGAGLEVLPSLVGQVTRVSLAPAGVTGLPRFDQGAHLAALAGDPPRWPERTGAVSLLALDLEVAGRGFADSVLPARRLRLELLDYPGEWLLDLPLLAQDFSTWSGAVLRRLGAPEVADVAGEFLAFVRALPAGVAASDALVGAGQRLYRAMLGRLRDELGLSFLQPGRFLMPAPGPEPVWGAFFPFVGEGGLAGLMAQRFEAYKAAVREDLVSPLFGSLDRVVVLADLLSALHAGPAAFADAEAALTAAAGALRWRGSWLEALGSLATLRLPPRVIRRVAYAATKADHVADRQRGNLAALVRSIVSGPGVATASFAIASVRCTQDFVWTLEGHPVSAVRGRRLGDERVTRSYPGEVPDRAPDAEFWAHPFLALPQFEPMRLPGQGGAGVPAVGLDGLMAFLLGDLL